MEPTKEHLLWMYEEQTVYLNERFQVAQKMRKKKEPNSLLELGNINDSSMNFCGLPS